MPQLDTFSYMSQVVWLFFCFFFMYIYLTRISLPRIYKILFVRRVKLFSYVGSIRKLDREIFILSRGFSSISRGLFFILTFLPMSLLVTRELSLNTLLQRGLNLFNGLTNFGIDANILVGGLDSLNLLDNTVYLENRVVIDLKKRVNS